MKKSYLAAVAVIFAFAVVGCNKLTQYTLSEQEINTYLQKHNNFDKSVGLPGLANATIRVSGLTSQIGRQSPDTVGLTGDAKVNLDTLWGSQRADVKLTLQAKPYYDVSRGAIYLREMRLVDYQVQPAKLDSTFKILVPYLDTAMASYFESTPAYVLDPKRNSTEAIAKKLATGLEVRPGELVIPFTR